MPSFTERQEGPNGQYCELLTRYDYDRMQRIEEASITRMNVSAFADACLREGAFEFMVKHAFTGEELTENIGQGDPAVVKDWRDRAVELYVTWKQEAFPKAASAKGKRRSATSETESSSD